jgi:hypothetical protein
MDCGYPSFLERTLAELTALIHKMHGLMGSSHAQ